jgi:hypothetical protein
MREGGQWPTWVGCKPFGFRWRIWFLHFILCCSLLVVTCQIWHRFHSSSFCLVRFSSHWFCLGFYLPSSGRRWSGAKALPARPLVHEALARYHSNLVFLLVKDSSAARVYLALIFPFACLVRRISEIQFPCLGSFSQVATFCSQVLSSSHVNRVYRQAIFFFQVSSSIWSLLGLRCVDFGIKVFVSLFERFFTRGFDFHTRCAERFTDLSRFSRCRFSCSGHRLCSGPYLTHSSWTVLLESLFLESLVASVQSAALNAANAESDLVLWLLLFVLVFSGAAIDLGLDFSRGGFGLRCLLLIYSPPVRFRVCFLLRAEAIGWARAFCPKSQCRSPVFLRLYRFDLHLVLIFLFGLVSQCVRQEHVCSGLDFTLGFRFRSSCSVFAPRSGVSSCSRAGLAGLGFPRCPFSFSWWDSRRTATPRAGFSFLAQTNSRAAC